jgi:hypothetical protein
MTTVVNLSQERVDRLPDWMRTAQEAITLPEVQDMIRRLSEYNLGVYLLHTHDDETGAFQPMPPGLTQVEDGLRVAFHQEGELADREDLIPVGWAWRAGATPMAKCVIECVGSGSLHQKTHK